MMPTTMERPTTLIVLAWNSWDLTRVCLSSLLETELDGAEILVVDNGSTDETPQQLESITGIRTLTLPRNLGFVRGNNAGIAAARPDSDIVLLNNDLVFTQRDWLLRLRECAHSAADVGVVGCRLVLPDGRLLHAGTYVMPDTLWGQQIASREADVFQYTSRRDVEGIVFACAYIRRELLQAIGGLSEAFESYFEDTDYCLRAAEAGFRTVLCGDVTLVHDEHGSTQGLSEERTQLFVTSSKVFARRWRKRLAGRYRRDLVWQSIMNFPTGYSACTRALLQELDSEGVRSVYRYVYGPGTSYPVPEPEDALDYRLNVIRARQLPRRRPLSVVFGRGDVFDRSLGRTKIGFTMLEVDGFPTEWVRQANRMDEVWVPSRFNLDGFNNSGLRRPIHTIPLGIDPNYFHPGIRAHPNPHGEFIFLSTLEWGERKDPWLLLGTFNNTFTASEPVRLLVKIINRDPAVSITDEIGRLDLKASGGRISFLFNLDFPYYQMGSLYRSADCFVSPSRGEGWNMPVMEAMACGLPVIATDWGPHREFLNSRVGFPLRIRGTVPAAARCPYYKGFSWADPDPEHLRHLLRWVFENQEEARAVGQRAAGEIATRFTWKASAQRIVERLDALCGR